MQDLLLALSFILSHGIVLQHFKWVFYHCIKPLQKHTHKYRERCVVYTHSQAHRSVIHMNHHRIFASSFFSKSFRATIYLTPLLPADHLPGQLSSPGPEMLFASIWCIDDTEIARNTQVPKTLTDTSEKCKYKTLSLALTTAGMELLVIICMTP